LNKLNADVGTGGFIFPQVYQKNNTIIENAFKTGDVDYIELTQWNFADEFFSFILENGFLPFADESYPNPRDVNAVPIWFLLCSQFLLRLYNSGKYHHLKYLLNSGSILTRLGFNVSNPFVDGFNGKNKYDRKTAVDPDTVRKFFKDTSPLHLRKWHNNDVQHWFKSKRVFDEKGLFVLDQSHLVVPDNPNYKDARRMPVDEFGQWYKNYSKLSTEQKKILPHHPCYTLSSLLHVDTSKDFFHIAGYDFGPGNEDELVQGRKLINNFCQNFPGIMKELIVDRGYIDGKLIGILKNEYNVDILIPLRSDMETYRDAIVIANGMDKWKLTEHDETKEEGKLIKETYSTYVADMDLWEECPVKLHAYVSKTKRWSNKKQEYQEYFWVLVSSKKYISEKAAISRYGLRFQIEERFRQLKHGWGLHKFTSPSDGLLESHLAFTTLSYSMLQLYLRRNNLQKETHKMINSLRNNEQSGRDAVIIYAGDCFGTMDLDYCLSVVAGMEEEPRKKIQSLMKVQIEARRIRENSKRVD
jgi:hypothetical protein